MKTIVVVGTVGKSSQTLLLSEMYKADGWTVFTGTTQKKNLNTLTGLSMVIGGFLMEFESRSFIKKWLKTFEYIVRCLYFIGFQQYTLPEKSIFIFEIGYDDPGEAELFTPIFESGITSLIVTALTWEHSMAFNDIFDRSKYAKIKDILPDTYITQFENPQISNRLKNIALEQLLLLPLAKTYILPDTIGELTNSVITMKNKEYATHTVQSDRTNTFGLRVDDEMEFSDDYLLPTTFGKTAYVCKWVGALDEIASETVSKVIHKAEFPYSRFSMFEGKLQTTIVDSSYNSDPASVSGFLSLATEVIENYNTAKKHTLQTFIPKHYIILGEMRELGETAVAEHQHTLDRLIEMGNTHSDCIEQIYLLGAEWLACNEDGVSKSDNGISFIRYKKQVFKVYNRVAQLQSLLHEDTIRPGNWFWIKGSQNTIYLESLVRHILANPEDGNKVCRQGKVWDEMRAPFVLK